MRLDSKLVAMSNALGKAILAEKLSVELVTHWIVDKWLVSDPLDAVFGPLGDDYRNNGQQNESLVSAVDFLPPGGSGGTRWERYEDPESFLTYLRNLNNESQTVLAACGVHVTHEMCVVARVYNKGNLRVWLNALPVFVGHNGVKNIDELFFVTLQPGLNVFIFEKNATSIKFALSESTQAYEAMSTYLSRPYLDRARTEMRIVPEQLLGASTRFKCVLIPRDMNVCRRGLVKLCAQDSDGLLLWQRNVPVRRKFMVDLPDVSAPITLAIDAADKEYWGSQRLFVGDIEKYLAQVRSLFAEQCESLPSHFARDIGCWIDDLDDIWRREESAAYEARRTFMEEVNAFCNGVTTLANILSEHGTVFENKKKLMSGLVVHSFESTLDGSLQYYYAYIPNNYRFEYAHPVVVLLKYLYKKVQIPGFAFDSVLAEIVDNSGVIFISPCGRGINRYTYAGETDLFEALDDLSARYNLARDRVFLAGFSMGGGAALTLLQKFPARFAGAFGWSCDIIHRYATNLTGKRLVYLSGETDSMFLYGANHEIISGFVQENTADVVENRRVSGGHHFSLFHIYDDIKLISWATSPPSTHLRTNMLTFCTDDLRYCHAGWGSILETKHPGELSEIIINRANGRIELNTRNISRLTLSMRKIISCTSKPVLLVDGRVAVGEQPSMDKDWELAGLAIGEPTFVVPNNEARNSTGAGIAEIYYGPVTVLVGDVLDPADAGYKWAKRLARSFARPAYYGNFREKYAEIPIHNSSTVEFGDLTGRSVVLIGTRTSNCWLRRALDKTNSGELIARLLSHVPAPVCAVWLKTAGITLGTFTVLVLLQDAVALEAFADIPSIKGQFVPTFSGHSDLMHHDAIIFCSDGQMYAAYLNSQWQLDSVQLVERHECCKRKS